MSVFDFGLLIGIVTFVYIAYELLKYEPI
jgi:hypothetical protein